MGFLLLRHSAASRTLGGRLLPLPLLAEHLNHSRTTKRWHGDHRHNHHHHLGEAGEGVFKLGLAADVALAAGKALTGYLSGSTAIAADAAHSVSDVVLSGVAWWSFRASRVPTNREHPYGHGKFESLGALGISCMLLVSAGGIAWHALDILYGLLTTSEHALAHSLIHEHKIGHIHNGHHHHGIDLDHPVLALSMTITSISVKEGLYRITKRAGDRDGSGLMKANAWHHRADAVSSLVALVGVAGAIVGVPFLDPLAGLLVSGMILKAGIGSGYQSVMELVDAGVPLSSLAPIKQTVLHIEGVKGCHNIRGRKAGSLLYLDIHIEMEPSLSVSAAHDLSKTVRDRIYKCHSGVAEIHINIVPFVRNTSAAMPDEGNTSVELQSLETENLGSKKIDTRNVISNIISSKFPEMSIERISPQSLREKVHLDVHVSMPPDVTIRDAMRLARDAEEEILKADSSISQASILLRLGHRNPREERVPLKVLSRRTCQLIF